ncbi:YaiI/YqxD family protein [Amaricoccus tamworthensis]|uniref:YaiI/YqxD family protein n=1 Tax=Amaricoccus tamworthensis TaxID=57002 RepID=UPI003C7CFBC1
MAVIYVDADACPVRDETVKVAERHQVEVVFVTNGGLRPSRHPLVRIVVVDQGADVADMWIAERAGAGDVCITADVPLAARCVGAGALVLGPDGQEFSRENVGDRLAMRDLMADLRAADPFRQGGGKPFSKADRGRYLERLDAVLRRAARA